MGTKKESSKVHSPCSCSDSVREDVVVTWRMRQSKTLTLLAINVNMETARHFVSSVT